MTRTPGPLPAAVATVLAFLAAGCGSEDPPQPIEPDTPTITTSAPTRLPTPAPTPSIDPHHDPQQQAIDAYLGMQRAYLEATQTADPDHPELARYAVGDALELLRSGLASLRDRGLRGRGEATFQPAVESLDPVEAPTTITVRDCMDTTAAELYRPSGEPYDDEPGGLRLVVATAEIIDGTWKVTSFGVHEVGTCNRSD